MISGETVKIALYASDDNKDLSLSPHNVEKVKKVNLESDYMIFVVDNITKDYLIPVREGLKLREDSLVFLSPVLGDMGFESESISAIKDLTDMIFCNEESIIDYIKKEEKDDNRFAFYHKSLNKISVEPWMKYALRLVESDKNEGRTLIIGRIDGIYFGCNYIKDISQQHVKNITISKESSSYFYRDSEQAILDVHVSKSVYGNVETMLKINERITQSYLLANFITIN